MAISAEPLDTISDFATPEHIAFRYRVAGPMARGMAYLLDMLIRIAVILLALFVLTQVGIISGIGSSVGLFLLLLFVLDWGYGGLFEWLWHGQTPGKRALGIRVVSTDGLPAGAGACFARNILRSADAMPASAIFGFPMPLFLIGLASMLVLPRFQRLGDIVAGTLVVYNEGGGPGKVPRFKDERLAQRANELPPDLLDRVDARTIRAISQFIARRSRVGPARRNEMAAHLAEPLLESLALEGQWGADELLCAVYLRAYQTDDDRGAGRAAAVIKQRSQDWRQLERMIDAQPKNARAAFNLSHHYRAACADLAIADAYQLPKQQVHYLHDLVGRAHLAFYRQLVVPVSKVMDVVFVKVPGMLYNDACLRLAFLAFFVTFAVAAYAGWADEQVARTVLGEEMIDMMQVMYSDAPDNRQFGEAVGMSGYYVHNNVGIALTCFATGIFLGIGSLIYLMYNGVLLGLVFGFMAQLNNEIEDNFFQFVAAHGPFELTGIALSGAAGFRLGISLIARGGRPWRDSLRHNAGDAFAIAIVAAIMVGMAAPIEGFISPSALPLVMKQAVGWTCLVVVLFYLVALGRRGHRILRVREALNEPG